MSKALEQIQTSAVYALIVFLIIMSFMSVFSTEATDGIFPAKIELNAGDNSAWTNTEKPVLVVKSAVMTVDETFNPKLFIETATYRGTDVKNMVEFYGDVDTSRVGEYHLVYFLKMNGVMARQEATFVVEERND